MKELSSDLRNYSQNLDNDTERLNEIQERLYMLDKLKRKYGGSLLSVLETYKKLSEELASIEFSTKNIEEIEAELTQTRKKLELMAATITEHRNNYANVLSAYIQEKLEKLELPKAKFQNSCNTKGFSVGRRR